MSIVKIVDTETGEEIERPMTKAEIELAKSDAEQTKARIKAEEAKTAAKLALLDKLGLTEDEAKLLLQ